MNERIVVEHATEVQVANLAQSRTLRVTKPQGDQSIVLDLSDRNATFDLSAVADEKMTLVKVGPKLIILFDNQSTVTVDPFFDFSGKPLANLDVELGAGRAVNGEQFAQLFSITEDQSVLRAAGIIPPSGADFHDASVDALPDGLRPLALLQHEGLATRISDADDASSRHSIATVSPKPTITVPSPGGPTTTVFEAGLLASRGAGELAGTHAGQSSFPTTTKAGTINFSSPDGVLKIELGGHELSGTAQTFTDATGSLTASYAFNTATGKGTITYSYTLLDNTQGIPNASFAVVVTDKDGDSNPPVSLVISIVDDAPVAHADTDTIAGPTMAATGNVLTGIGTASGPGNADVSGADGGAQVVGVATGNGTGGINPGSVGIAIAGAFGTLTLNADGSYTYVHAVGGGADVFTYTIQDTDGTLSHTTLTISLADSAPGNIVVPGPGGADTQVFEAGLLASRGPGESAGSHAGQSGFPTTTQAGTITFTSMWGRLRSPRCLAKFCFRGAAVGRGLADARICQNGLRNRIIDRKPLGANVSPHRGHKRENRSDSKKLHSAASNKSWFPHIVGKAEKSALNIIKYIVEMVNKWLTRRRGAETVMAGLSRPSTSLVLPLRRGCPA